MENCNERTLPSLPPEILSIIFAALARVSPIINSTRTTSFCLGWLVVTHVCRRWRTVAAEDKALWSQITTIHTQLFQLFVERCKPMPLSVYGRGHTSVGRDNAGAYLALVLDQLQNTWSLDIDACVNLQPHMDMNDRFMGAFNESAYDLPLQSLSLRFNPGCDNALAPRFFARTPHLRELSLSDMGLSILASNSNIQYLHLRHLLEFSAMDALEALRHLHNLECLVLDEIEYSFSSEATIAAAVPLVILPHLKMITLKVSQYSLRTTGLLKYIESHPHAYVNICCSGDTNPCSKDGFLDNLCSYYERHPMSDNVSVCVDLKSSRDYLDWAMVSINVSLIASQTTTRICLPTRTIPVNPGFRLSTAIPKDNFVDNPSSQLLSLPTFCPTSWTSITVRDSDIWDSDELIYISYSATNVQQVSFCNLGCDVLLVFFAYVKDASPLQTDLNIDSPILLPNLTLITLEGLAYDCEEAECPDLNLLTAEVESALSRRNEIGLPIQHIYLRKCIRSIELMHFKGWDAKYGCEVHWDGSGGPGAVRGRDEDEE